MVGSLRHLAKYRMH